MNNDNYLLLNTQANFFIYLSLQMFNINHKRAVPDRIAPYVETCQC